RQEKHLKPQMKAQVSTNHVHEHGSRVTSRGIAAPAPPTPSPAARAAARPPRGCTSNRRSAGRLPCGADRHAHARQSCFFRPARFHARAPSRPGRRATTRRAARRARAAGALPSGIPGTRRVACRDCKRAFNDVRYIDSMPISRRRFLAAAALLAGAAPLGRLYAQARFDRDPFTLGVASGYPAPEGVVLWTRLAPDPQAGGGMPPGTVEVGWEVATDEAFRTIVRSGKEGAATEWAHSVHAEVAGLAPGREYFYRFHAGGATSPVGRTRTAPAAGASGRLRFAFASCQQYEQGYYSAYRHMAQEDLD